MQSLCMPLSLTLAHAALHHHHLLRAPCSLPLPTDQHFFLFLLQDTHTLIRLHRSDPRHMHSIFTREEREKEREDDDEEGKERWKK